MFFPVVIFCSHCLVVKLCAFFFVKSIMSFASGQFPRVCCECILFAPVFTVPLTCLLMAFLVCAFVAWPEIVCNALGLRGSGPFVYECLGCLHCKVALKLVAIALCLFVWFTPRTAC